MYLRSVEIANVRSIRKLRMTFKKNGYAGWHVVIGDNGSGKSTLVRAVALALVGADEASALRENWSEWLRRGKSRGHISVEIDDDPHFDKATGSGRHSRGAFVEARLGFHPSKSPRDGGVELYRMKQRSKTVKPDRYIWGKGQGWFCASYGPFRRFTGGNKDYEKLFWSNPRLAPHLSAFGEGVALTECLDWLQSLHVKNLEGKTEDGSIKELKTFLNGAGLLPYDTRLDSVTSDAVVFRDGDGCDVSVENLSDGYRSILSLTLELVRQMVRVYGPDQVFQCIREGQMAIDLPGVVLIDEVDAHLHPSWQRRVGDWFRKYFPKVQFIVTTHSPLICHSAETGSVWRLRAPGADTPQGKVTGLELKRLLFGSVLEAYDTEMFGRDVTRSPSSTEKLERLAQLNVKSLAGQLSGRDRREQEELRAMLPTSAGVGHERKGSTRK